MPAERYYIDEVLSSKEKKVLQGAEYHHLAHVMRTRVGEIIELVNGRGELAVAVVETMAKDRATLNIQDFSFGVQTQSSVILAQGMPKPNRLDFILEKGTELGVAEFWLFPSHHSIKKEIYPNQVERMNSLIIAAMKQCGRLFLPKIIIKPPMQDWSKWEGVSFFGDTDPGAIPFWTVLQQQVVNTPIMIYVGPESGFSDKETEWLRNKEVKGVKLHENILRTDTAAITAVGLVKHWLLCK